MDLIDCCEAVTTRISIAVCAAALLWGAKTTGFRPMMQPLREV
jgi:hypothetical protein